MPTRPVNNRAKTEELERHSREINAIAANDPVVFAKHACYTINNHAPTLRIPSGIEIAPFPVEYEFLAFLLRFLHTHRRSIIYLFKSRNVLMTWLLTVYGLWRLIYDDYFEGKVRRKKGSGADELLAQIHALYVRIPDWFKLGMPRTLEYVASKSIITGYNRDGTVGSKFTISTKSESEERGPNLNLDMWDEFEESENPLRIVESAHGAGRSNLQHFAVATPDGPSQMYKHIFNDLKPYGKWMNEVAPFLWHGINENGHHVFCLSFMADPTKRPDAENDMIDDDTGEPTNWYHSIYGKLDTRTRLREYGTPDGILSFETFGDEPYFGDFNPRLHVVDNLAPIEGMPIILGVDFGEKNPAAVWCQCTDDGRVRVIDELNGPFGSFDQFIAILVQKNEREYKDYVFYACGDPSGDLGHKNESPLNYFHLFIERTKIRMIRPPRTTPVNRGVAIGQMLVRNPGGKPGIIISGKKCEALLEAFSGGYRCKVDKKRNLVYDVPDKDKVYSHIVDALGYAVVFMRPTLFAGVIGGKNDFPGLRDYMPRSQGDLITDRREEQWRKYVGSKSKQRRYAK